MLVVDINPIADCDDEYDAVYFQNDWECPCCGHSNSTFTTSEPTTGEVYNTQSQGILIEDSIIYCNGCCRLLKLLENISDYKYRVEER